MPADLRDEYRVKAWNYHLEGYSYREIARFISKEAGEEIMHSSIWQWLATDRKQLVKQRPDVVAENRETVAAQIDKVLRTGMRDLDTTIQVDYDDTGDGKPERINRLVDRIDPDASRAVMDALKTKIKLFGLNIPEKKEISITATLSDLIGMTGKVTEKEIEAEFKEVDGE